MDLCRFHQTLLAWTEHRPEIRVVQRPGPDKEQQLHRSVSIVSAGSEPRYENVNGVAPSPGGPTFRLVQSTDERRRQVGMTNQKLQEAADRRVTAQERAVSAAGGRARPPRQPPLRPRPIRPT